MVNAIELRVDNLVKCKKSNDAGYYRVAEIGGWIRRWDKKKKDESFIDERLIKINGGARDGEIYGESDLNPIPLTSEILEKCGFKKSKAPNHEERKMVDILYIDAGYVQITYTMGETLLIAKNTPHESGQVILNKMVKNLHQLQNLYFALTGEELTYTP